MPFKYHFDPKHPLEWVLEEVGLKMAAPTNLAVSFDKAQYNPGDTVTALVTFASGEQVSTTTFTLTVMVQNQNSESTDVTGTFEVATSAPNDTFTVSATDDGNHTWNVEMGSDGLSATLTTTV